MTDTVEEIRVMDDAAPGISLRRLGTRRRAGLLIHGVAALGLIPAFAYLTPSSRWDRPLLLGTLVLLAILADRAEVPLPSSIRLDATAALWLIAVALLGPLAALLVAFSPVLFNAATRRDRLLRAGNLANLAAFGWEVVVVSLLLAHTVGGPLNAFTALPWLLVAGPLLLLINFAVGPAIYSTLWLGHPPRALAQMLADGFPALSVMVSLGALTVALNGSFGVLSLTLFALIAVLPQTALTHAARTRPVARLDRLTASRRYANAMGMHLSLNRSQRRHVDRVVRLADARANHSGDPLSYAFATLRDPSRASCEAGHVGEWWNGGGGPAGLRGPVTPLSARIAAVADTWSALTARDTPALSHEDALKELDAAAGTRLDPYVVAAAHKVVAQERVSAVEPAPEPRLHHFGLPARLRSVLAAS